MGVNTFVRHQRRVNNQTTIQDESCQLKESHFAELGAAASEIILSKLDFLRRSRTFKNPALVSHILFLMSDRQKDPEKTHKCLSNCSLSAD